MLGTCPTFYLINITQSLADYVKHGKRPDYDTVVTKYIIPINMSDAMLSREHAYRISECYESFKHFVIKEDQMQTDIPSGPQGLAAGSLGAAGAGGLCKHR